MNRESCAGPRGDRLAITATVIVVVVVSQLIYGCLGIFGAARHGLATSGNVLSNEWLPLRAQVHTRASHSVGNRFDPGGDKEVQSCSLAMRKARSLPVNDDHHTTPRLQQIQ